MQRQSDEENAVESTLLLWIKVHNIQFKKYFQISINISVQVHIQPKNNRFIFHNPRSNISEIQIGLSLS